MNADREKLSSAVWIRLAKCYGLVLREIRNRQVDTELTLPQFDVLGQLLRSPDGMTMGSLSRALLVTAGNVSGIVDRLEERGFVERQQDTTDRRVTILRLTVDGRRAAQRELTRQEASLCEIFEKLPPEEFARINDALDALRHSLPEH